MNSKEIIDYLKSEASEKYKENVIKMGIPEKFCISVRFKFADEFRRIAEYIEINTTKPAVAG